MGSSSSRQRPPPGPSDAYAPLPGSQQQHQGHQHAAYLHAGPQQQQWQHQQQQWQHQQQQQQQQQQQWQHQQQHPQAHAHAPGPYATNGQFYGAQLGYAPPQHYAHQAQHWAGPGPHVAPHAQPPVAAAGGYMQRPPAAVLTQQYQQTATIKNQVNLKKQTLRLQPLAGRPHDFSLSFRFDATAPCRVTTLLLATEDPRNGCSLVSAVFGAPPRRPVCFEKGMDHEFPPAGHSAAADSHVISSLHAPMGHMVLASGDSYPLVIRLESVMEGAAAQGHSLEQLEVGGALPAWAQAQTTYAKLRQDEAGHWQIQVLKQKIWVNGQSYELQEIYGASSGAAGGGDAGDDLGGSECVICMSAPRDTTVLPCRHMCMCAECAGALKMRTNKCPICRQDIESLLHIRINNGGGGGGRSQSSSPVRGERLAGA